jgi:glucosamine kinase
MLGGWGFPIGDRGGGAWLGFRLVGDWLERRDGLSPITADGPLWEAVRARLGETRPDILAWLRRARPTDFAGLTPAIVAAAAQGDAYADALLDEAAAHLLRLAQALRPSPTEPLCLSGGLASVLAPASRRRWARTALPRTAPRPRSRAPS